MRKEVKLDNYFGKEYSGKYVFQTISWATSNRITGDCTSVDPVSRRSSVDLKRLQALMLDATMIERPKEITLDLLMSEEPDKGLPPALGDLLMSLADKVNGYGDEDRDQAKKLRKQWGLI